MLKTVLERGSPPSLKSPAGLIVSHCPKGGSVKFHKRQVAVFAGLLLAVGVASATAPAMASAATTSSHARAVATGGHGTARAFGQVSVRAAAAGRQLPARGLSTGPLGRDGKPAGAALPVRASKGAKPHPAGSLRLPGGPNSTSGARPSQVTTPGQVTRPFTPPANTTLNIAGATQGNSSCGQCQPPDPSAGVSATEIAHTVNLQLAVFNKSGGLLCTVGLNTFLGTSDSLSDPRIQYDNANNRWSLVLIPVPASSGAAPAEWLAASTGPDACGSWFRYRITFSGGSFPAGALLDYPYLGQDGTSILSSTNNFAFAGSYIVSTAFAIPKANVYAGAGFSFTAFNVAFSTAPVTVAGIPMFTTTTTYWLASVPGTGYDLYAMPTTPAGSITLQAVISSPFSAPTRRVNQPGTGLPTLDPQDGRIDWAPVQDGGFVWFTHGMDIGGFPGIRYGAIGVATNTAFTAEAFHSGSSDDFNPSIGVSDAGGGTNHIWLNWAYDDAPAGVPTSDTIDGVLPGGGAPNLIATDRTLVTGSTTNSNSRFGDFSSVEVDPSSGGLAAVSSNEFFFSGAPWATVVSETSF
jgi:hypothetical protein